MSNKSRPFQSIHDTLRNTFKRRTPSRSSTPSTPAARLSDSESGSALPHTGVGTDAPQPRPTSQRPLSRLSNSSNVATSPGDGADASKPQNPPARYDTYNQLLNDADTPQTLAKDVGDMVYVGFKGLLAMLNTVGYALPPLKAAAAGLSSVLTVIDVCTSWPNVTVQD
jgi:hypothetical protein